MRWLIILAMLLTGCAEKPDKTRLVIQRFFGACEAEYGRVSDIARAQGECGIMTAIINRFEAENPDIDVVENIVFWPGYDQLTAQLAANDPPDLVTMHGSVIPDYQARGLLEPLDADLPAIGVAPAALTPAARTAVTMDGRIWGLPMDSWAPLWHINMNLFRQAGLVRDGAPLLPRNPQELIEHATRFEKRTGKPYLVQATANEYAQFTRNFYTYVMQQGGTLYPSPDRATFRTPEAERALGLFKDIWARGLTTRNQDYSAAVASFLRGGGGVFLVGTWMVGDFTAEAAAKGKALSGGYAVVPYPQLFGARDATFADGHNWVMPRNDRRTPAQRAAALAFLKLFATHNLDWARTGHLPVFTRLIESEAWRSMPGRSRLAELSRTGAALPKGVRRQFPIETIVGQEAAAAITGAKPIPAALADMERRVNDILSHL